MSVKILYLYPDFMSLYGDNGNVRIITRRLEDQGFDSKKARTLAASWYSTLVIRKANIYGKFKSAAGSNAKVKPEVAKKKVIKVKKATK